jgi:HSP20 family protein
MALELWRPRRGLARRAGREPVEDLVGRLFEDWLSLRMTGESYGWTPAIDMIDRKDEIVVRADLPGLEQKDIDVSVESGVLTIRGQRQEEREAKEEDYYCSERWVGSFARSVTLPPGVDTEKIKASFKNGVLEARIPKTQKAMGRRIEVQAA